MKIDEFYETVENKIFKTGMSPSTFFKSKGFPSPSYWFVAKRKNELPSTKFIIACEELIGRDVVVELLKIKRSQRVTDDELISEYLQQATSEKSRKAYRQAVKNAYLARAWELGV